MALLTNSQRRSVNLIVPFGFAGYVFYDAYAKKGAKDWKPALIMCLIVFAFCYVVTSQITKILSPET